MRITESQESGVGNQQINRKVEMKAHKNRMQFLSHKIGAKKK